MKALSTLLFAALFTLVAAKSNAENSSSLPKDLTFDSKASLGPTYRIDPNHSSVSFKARHLMINNVPGHFESVTGTLNFDPNNMDNCYVDSVINVASIDTDKNRRDNHLRSDDFLNAEEHPLAHFRSKKWREDPTDFEVYWVDGDLTIAGITQPVTLKVDYQGSSENEQGKKAIDFEGTTELKRLKWKVGEKYSGTSIGKKIKIAVNVQAVKV